jgi:hypothetical protein
MLCLIPLHPAKKTETKMISNRINPDNLEKMDLLVFAVNGCALFLGSYA